MNSIDREKIMTRLEEQYAVADEYGYETVGIFLYGSQNYGLDTEESDIDSKVIVIPKFTDFLHNKKPVSFTHVMENDEHVDFKDIRLMFQCYKKQNINFVETLFTEYFILNPEYEDLFSRVMDRREKIARYDIKAALWVWHMKSVKRCVTHIQRQHGKLKSGDMIQNNCIILFDCMNLFAITQETL